MEMHSTIHSQDDLMIVKSMQDVQPIMEDCKQRVEAGATGSSELKHAAQIPMVIIENYMNRLGISFNEFLHNKEHVRTMLNDKSLEAFRIWKGAV
jgi:hypothetical protein